MSAAIENLQAAMARAFAGRPRVGGFPYLSLYLTNDGTVVTMGTPLASGTTDVPPFDREALIKALRTDQAGNSTFPEFLKASWRVGVVRYDVDFTARRVAYYGAHDEQYVEEYPAVEVK
jgi:uncharacterized protein YbcV (DUF1398 family)